MVKKTFTDINQFIDKIQDKTIFRHVKTPKLTKFLDSIGFFQILVLWFVIISLFGLVYFGFSGEHAYLSDTNTDSRTGELGDLIYFSFVTATTTGFGDILPHGFFRVVAIIEASFGFILLAIVTSKIVSLKQDVMLGELYELSLSEKINRLRSSLLVFRQNISRVMDKVEDGSMKKGRDMYVHFVGLEHALHEAFVLMGRSEHEFTKPIDPVSAELIYTSFINSFEKLLELLELLDEHKVEWRREVAFEILQRSIDIDEQLFLRLEKMPGLQKSASDLIVRNAEVLEKVKKFVQ